MKIYLKQCPRCRGDLILEDIGFSCLQCGFSPPLREGFAVRYDDELSRYVLVKRKLRKIE